MAQGDVAQLMQMYDQMKSTTLGGDGAAGMGRPAANPQMQGQPPVPEQAVDTPVEGPVAGSIPPKHTLPLVDIGNGVQVDKAIVPDLADVLGHAAGLHVISGHRDEHQNMRASGVPMSRHLVGKAVDLAGSAKAMRDGAGRAHQIGVPEVSLEGAHLHLGWD